MRHRLRTPALVLVTLLALSACADASDLASVPRGAESPAPIDSPDQQSPPGDGEARPRPEVGQCRPTPQAVLARPIDPTAPVDCSEPHTLETYAVVELKSPDDEQQALKACQQRLGEYLGRADTAATRVSWFYFVAESDQAGAWLRCDVGLSTTTATGPIEAVTGSLEDVLANGVPPAQRTCLAAPPDPRRAQRLVSCTEAHVAELVPTSKQLGEPGTPYPGARQLLEANLDWCRRLTDKVDGAAISQVEVPTAKAWSAGIVEATCWAVAPEGSTLPPLGTTI